MSQSVNINFDASQGPSGFIQGPIPSNLYSLVISSSKLEPTKKGDGTRLVLSMTITEGPEQGKSFDYGINWENPNPKAVEIGQREFRAICQAIGVTSVPNTQVIHNFPFGGEVFNDGKYNELKDAFHISHLAGRLENYQAPPTPEVPRNAHSPGPAMQAPPAPFTPGAPAPMPTPPVAFNPPPQAQPVQQTPAPTASPTSFPVGGAIATTSPFDAIAAPPQAPLQQVTQPTPTATTPDWILAQQAAQAAAQ
jgi:hypothetical protein